MFEIAKLFYDIALFKKAPQDVPASGVLLRFVVFVYALISFMMLYMSTSVFNAVLQVAVELLLVFAFCKGLLYWIGKPERYQQTFIALVGIDALMSFFSFPALAALSSPNNGSVLGFFAVVGLMLWHLAVTGHILRHALSQPFIFGFGVALLYVMTLYQIMGWLFSVIGN